MSIDPRLMERRREVAEDRARRTIARLLRFLGVLGAGAAVVWLFLSPYLSVHEVRAAGVGQSETQRILAEKMVIAGTPMILLRPGSIEAALETDPWVAGARVELHWPNSVMVRVEERVPAAWVETGGGWTRRANDGAAVPSRNQPDETLGWVRLPDVPDSQGASSLEVLGGIEFLTALPLELQIRTVVTVESGELWAETAGYRVRLGRPVEMTAKALSLVALLQEGPPRESILTLIAPTHPAVTPVQPVTGTEPNPDSTIDGADVGGGPG